MTATADIATQALLDRARAGQRAAWNELAARHTHRVRVALLADGFGLDEAKDLAQDAWASIWDKHQRGELVEVQLPGLVIAQARFLAKDHRRRAQRPVSDGTDAQPSPPIDARLVAAEALHRVKATLDGRSAQQQRIFREAVEEQRPHADIARREQLSLQRVRQILWEVRRELRAALDQETP